MEKAPVLEKVEMAEPVFDLEELEIGETLIVKTRSGTTYHIENREDGLYISGHPEYCPSPIKTSITGIDSNNRFQPGKIGLGFKLGFSEQGSQVTTSRILEIIKA